MMKLPLFTNVSPVISPGINNLFCVLMSAMLFTRVSGIQSLSFRLKMIFGTRFLSMWILLSLPV